MISVNEFNTIIKTCYPSAKTALLLGPETDHLIGQIPLDVISMRKLYHTTRKFNIIYNNLLWCNEELPWLFLLDSLLEKNGIIINTLYYLSSHFVPSKSLIKKVDCNIEPQNLKLKVEWMKYFSRYWTCIYDSGIHSVWKKGTSSWIIPKVEPTVIYLNKNDKYIPRIVLGLQLHRICYNWRSGIIRETGGLVKDDLWFESVKYLVGAFYQRLLGGYRLQLRPTTKPCVVPGIISIPNQFGRTFNNISDPYL